MGKLEFFGIHCTSCRKITSELHESLHAGRELRSVQVVQRLVILIKPILEVCFGQTTVR